MSNTNWENWETIRRASTGGGNGMFAKFDNVIAAIVCRDGKLYFTPALVRVLNSAKIVALKSNRQQFAIFPATAPGEEADGYKVFFSSVNSKSARISVTRFAADELTVGGVYVGKPDSGAAVFSTTPQQLLTFPPAAHRASPNGKGHHKKAQ